MNFSTDKKLSAKQITIYILLIGVAITLLYFSFKGIDWETFWHDLSKCNWWWVILSMMVGVVEFIIRAIRWRLLLKQVDPKIKTISSYRGICIGNLTNFAIPRLGEIVRCSVVASSEKSSLGGIIGTVVIERGWDLICLLILTIVVFFASDRFGIFIKENILSNSFTDNIASIIIIGSILAVLIVLAIIFRKRLTHLKLFSKINQTITNFKIGLLSAFKLKEKWWFFFLTILLWTTFWLTSLLTIKAFADLDSFTWADALFLMVVGGLGWAVPVQAGIGAFHYIVSLALMQVYHTSHSQGILFATVSHTSQAVVMILLGIISFIGYSIQKTKNR